MNASTMCFLTKLSLFLLLVTYFVKSLFLWFQNDVQAMARCHRIGQTKSVMVYRLITRDW